MFWATLTRYPITIALATLVLLYVLLLRLFSRDIGGLTRAFRVLAFLAPLPLLSWGIGCTWRASSLVEVTHPWNIPLEEFLLELPYALLALLFALASHSVFLMGSLRPNPYHHRILKTSILSSIVVGVSVMSMWVMYVVGAFVAHCKLRF